MANEQRNKIKLNVRVARAKKKEWKKALADGETMSSLVQRAVDREINNEYVPIEAVEQTDDTGSGEDVSQLSEKLDELHRDIAAANSKIDTLAAVGDTEDSDDTESIEELAMDILPRLPAYPRDIPEYALKDMGGRGEMSKQEYIEFIIDTLRSTDTGVAIDGSANHFAGQLREPEHKARQALLHLEQETTENVHSAIVDGTRHWMRF
ncbi:hypothetical protein ACFQAS_02130 [Halopenitus salinus]|uniref:Uncharacterized protein n=1 Tax=Halopenitus salinus TaxID=1198295 RepID=A0ABD5URE3_9EURY